MVEEIKNPEDGVMFEYSFAKDYYDYDSLDWYEEAVDAYLDANYERAKTAAMLADFRLELEEEMEDELELDEEEEESEDEAEVEEAEAENEDEGAEGESETEANEDEAGEPIELQEIQVATGEELIKDILKTSGKTQANLAEAAGVSRSAVSTNLNKGVNAIQLDDFAAYLDALGYELIALPKDFEESGAAYVLTPEVVVEE